MINGQLSNYIRWGGKWWLRLHSTKNKIIYKCLIIITINVTIMKEGNKSHSTIYLTIINEGGYLSVLGIKQFALLDSRSSNKKQ